MKNYIRYGWVGNKISRDDMAKLYFLKKDNRKPITSMVAEAVSEYVKRKGG